MTDDYKIKITEIFTEKSVEFIMTEEGLEDENKLPFPRATVTNIMRKHIKEGKQIKGNVKDEMNKWVGKLILIVGEKMNNKPYTYVNYEMLKEAISPYENVQNIDEEKTKIQKHFRKIIEESNELIQYIDESASKKIKKLPLDQDLVFPKATITNKLRATLSEGKQIKGPVKKGLNIWLGMMVERVMTKMDKHPYAYIDGMMFRESIETYESIGEIEKEKERIIAQLQAITAACELLETEVERKFRI